MTDTLTDKQRYWQVHLDAAQAFDGTLVGYARAEGLDVKTLYGYRTLFRRRERRLAARSSFVQASSVGMGVSIQLPNGIRVSVSAQGAELGSLLQSLVQLP